MNISNFTKKKDYLVCVDSDGCAIDSMDIKHINCFGPCAVEEWGLEESSEKFLKRWNEINLYSKTRGINRFKGLAIIMEEFNLPNCNDLKNWVNTTKALSNEELIAQNNDAFTKVISWSQKVNKAIKNLPMPKAFDGVLETLSTIYEKADIAIVSSANITAIEEEWIASGLLKYVSVILSQNDGSKSECIKKLLTHGYLPENVLMLGDALGDLEAATNNNVSFYPIIPGKENESFSNLKIKSFDDFINKKLDDSHIQNFKNKLGL